MNKRRFTLVEVLVACGIIALLAGIGFAGYRYALNSSRESATKSLIYQLATALETCYNKYGFYPAADAGSEVVFTFDSRARVTKIKFGSTELESPDSAAEKKTTKGKYFMLLVNTLDLESIRNSSSVSGSEYTITDSWGGKIYYCYPGKVNKTKFDLVSAGADGAFGKDEAEKPDNLDKAAYLDGKDWLCDDIANF
jgi:type II secretory pathway pseudopilin PulG